MTKARVLLTGGFGYLGVALARKLAARHDTTAFGHRSRVALDHVWPAGVERVEGDLLDLPELLGDRRFTAIVHLAGGGGGGKCEADPVDAVRSNVLGTSMLIRFARDAGASRLLFASTIAVYGTHRAHAGPCTEDTPAAPDDLYGAVKYAAEHVWTQHGGGTALRLANVYGDCGGVDMGLQGAVERFARAAADGGTLKVYGEGTQRIDYVHIDDVADAFCKALDADTLPAVINIGGGAPIAIRDLAHLCVTLGQEMGAQPRIHNQDAPQAKVWPDRSLAIGRAREVLDWTPSIPIEDGLRALVRSLRKEGR